ncbi:MAG: DMT family transporter [Betaproteobacteria bacterium]|nr:DMT family transporter [Betaproteobacteria bacterium]
MTARPPSHVPPQAVFLIAGAVLCFALLDASVKALTQRYPVPLLVWARYGVQTLAMLLWLAPSMGAGLLRTRQLPMQIGRGVILVGSSMFFFNALRFLPLAEATALSYLTPMLVVLLSALLLRERLTWVRMALVGAGIAGMLLIVRPGTEVFQGAALLVLGSASLYAMYQILTRKLAAEDIRVTLFYPAIVGTALLTVALPWIGTDVDVSWTDALLIVVAGLLGTVGHFMFIRAFQHAPASALTPFTYLQLVWATLIGWAAFDRFPDRYALAGMAVISCSGLLVALHERRRARAAIAQPPVVD